MRVYDNFKQIDRDLKLLKLQQQIAAEQIKLNAQGIQEGLNPARVFINGVVSIGKKFLILKTTNKLLGLRK